MRTLGRSLRWTVWLLLGFAAGAALLSLRERLTTLTGSEQNERPLVFFVAERGTSLRFNLIGHSGWAVLYPAVVLEPGSAPPSYALRLRVFDAGGAVLRTDLRHVAHGPGFVRAAMQGRTAERPSKPVRWSSAQWIDLTDLPQAAAVEATVLPAHAEGQVPTLAWRAFLMRPLDDAAARARFREMRRSEREALTEPFLTPPGLLPEPVRLELSRRLLEPIPALQAGNGRVREQTLYMRRTRAQTATAPAVDAAELPGGWPIAPDLPVTLALEETTEIDLLAIDASGRPLSIRMRHGHAAMPGMRHWPAAADRRVPPRRTLPAGVYRFDSERTGLLRIRAVADGRPLLPDALRIATFDVGPDMPLDYAVHPVAGRPLRVRVDLRMRDPDGQPATGTARVHALDADGTTLVSHTIPLQRLASLHERAAASPDVAANVAARRILDLPGAARRLRIESDVSALATVYAEGTQRAAGPARWFSFHPQGRERLSMRVILRQPGWPTQVRDGMRDGGHGHLVALEPLGPTRLQTVLMPERLEPGRAPPPPGLPDRLRSLDARGVWLEWRDGRAPMLVWRRERASPSRVQLDIDGQTVDIPFVGRSGMTDLPGLPEGRHRVRLRDGGGARWMVSRAEGGDWRLRRLWTLSDAVPLRFSLPHAAVPFAEQAQGTTIHVQVFQAPGQPPPRLWATVETASGPVRVEARPRERGDQRDVWPLWSDAGPWRGPQRFAMDLPHMSGQAFALHCAGCRDSHAWVFRMSPQPRARTISAHIATRQSAFADDDGLIEPDPPDVH